MSESNIAVIQDIYAAFGRGDVPAILERVTPDTRWDYDVSDSDVPWHVPVVGRDEVPRFLGAFAENVELGRFEPAAFMDCGDHVLVHVRIAYAVKATGRQVEMDQLHWWTLRDGRAARLRHFEDTAQVLRAHAAA